MRSRSSLIMNLFTEAGERAKAMGVYGFVCAGGGSIGVLLGGVLTDVFDWHWIFLVNLPIGVGVVALCLALLPGAGAAPTRPRLDVAGAITVTAALMLAVYAVVDGNEAGWTSPRTLGLLAAAALLFAVFLAIEARVREPLMPLRLFRSKTLAARTRSASSGRRRCSRGSSSPRSTCSSCSATTRDAGRPRLPAVEPHHGGVLARPLGALVMRFGMRTPLVVGLLLRGDRPRAVRARAGRRRLRRRRAARHAAARPRRRHRLQPAAAGGDETTSTRANRASPRASSTPRS